MESKFKPGIRVRGISDGDKGKTGTIMKGTEWIGPNRKPRKPSTGTPTWWVLWDGEKEMKPMAEDNLEIITR